MRWNQLAAAVIVACATTACLAETPEFSNNRPFAAPLMQGRLFGGQGWWSRFGEPVNATALAQEQASPSDQAPAGPMPMYGDGYIYGPGSCDCPPPCIWHLWSGYFQNPKRCREHHLFRRNCDNCSENCGTCNTCGPLARIFGHCGCNSCSTGSCSASASCGCTTPVTCTTAAPDCGCKPVCCKCRTCHFGDRWRGFMAHWSCGCNSCSSPVGCGCATPASPAPSQSIPTPAPQYGEKQASQRPPVPLPDDAVLYPLPRLN